MCKNETDLVDAGDTEWDSVLCAPSDKAAGES
jgi:hypothetical protein